MALWTPRSRVASRTIFDDSLYLSVARTTVGVDTRAIPKHTAPPPAGRQSAASFGERLRSAVGQAGHRERPLEDPGEHVGAEHRLRTAFGEHPAAGEQDDTIGKA